MLRRYYRWPKRRIHRTRTSVDYGAFQLAQKAPNHPPGSGAITNGVNVFVCYLNESGIPIETRGFIQESKPAGARLDLFEVWHIYYEYGSAVLIYIHRMTGLSQQV